MTNASEGWKAISDGRQGLCALCPNPSTVQLRISAIEKTEKGKVTGGKSVANKSIMLCDACGQRVFKDILGLLASPHDPE